MEERSQYVKDLEEFKELLNVWYTQESDYEMRSRISKKIIKVKKIVSKAGTLKKMTVSPPPALGGVVMRGVDPFSMIFDPPYGVDIIPTIIDMLDEAIGVIETTENFNLNTKDDLPKRKQKVSNRIFLVHGHDHELKEKTARFLEHLDLEPIILHEQASKGLTIIEKFEEYSDVAFAIVLLTPDDQGGKIGGDEKLQKRARQNVIFELGYFIGKLGRKNVVGLVKDKIEIPSDFAGVIYINVDNYDSWKMLLGKEMKESGLNIDMNKMI